MASAATEGKIISQLPDATIPQESAFLPVNHTATNTAQSAPLFENILRYRLAARNKVHNCPFNRKCGRTPSYQYEGSYHGGEEPRIFAAKSSPARRRNNIP